MGVPSFFCNFAGAERPTAGGGASLIVHQPHQRSSFRAVHDPKARQLITTDISHNHFHSEAAPLRYTSKEKAEEEEEEEEEKEEE